MKLDHLFQPIRLGRLELSNRVLMGSMHTGLEGEEAGSQALIDFYKERAGQDGPGLIVTGGISVSPEGDGGHNFMGFYSDEHCKHMESLTAQVHAAGGRIAAQLFHAGRYAYSDLTGILAVAPSAIRSPIHRHTPRELTNEEIEELIARYAVSAKKAADLGFDAVEIMGSEGYLINQFLSPATNKRTDAWGGSFEHRTRFALRIAQAVREAVGPGYPVIFRLSGADLVPDSTTEEETLQFARMVANAGVDAINVGIGWHESQVPTISMMVPRAGYIHIAESIKRAVNIPVIGSNRINDPRLADELLQRGACDLVSMARPFLADPDLLRKARDGQFDRINTCIACNQACLDQVFEGRPASCLVNPRVGRESKWKPFRVQRPRHIAVIGGGAAGMEAARALAEIGERVVLYEKEDRLGGQLNLARRIPGKQEFAETLRYYQHELHRLGVDIRLNHSPTPEEIAALAPDLVVLASGIKPRIPELPGISLPHVWTYQQVLRGEAEVGKRVVIIGAGGIGCDLAHYLSEQAEREIYLLRRKGKPGETLGKTTRWALLSHLRQKKVQFVTDLSYERIDEDGVIIQLQTESGSETKKIPADTVILAAGQLSEAWDYQLVQRAGIPVVKIGGARFPGELDAKRAIYEGACVAYEEGRLAKTE
ncbi:NADPH-dependent 2,4-dienoyl-CoA reductase [Paenibacillus tyrfis]|uniref:NADPH-dependent 2,4-dienoyl-CoA reductase n=1 Tax=Paenibacillus tyrfis TaxID=1501230 RepID=UPI000B594BF9|nr:NADPH-dependent 2,4-dienoyl-CoA reductase [Paenibacillus tyrfis]